MNSIVDDMNRMMDSYAPAFVNASEYYVLHMANLVKEYVVSLARLDKEIINMIRFDPFSRRFYAFVEDKGEEYETFSEMEEAF